MIANTVISLLTTCSTIISKLHKPMRGVKKPWHRRLSWADKFAVFAGICCVLITIHVQQVADLNNAISEIVAAGRENIAAAAAIRIEEALH